MENHTTIKLNIPQQDLTTLALFQPNTESASEWVQSLPVTNTNSLVQLLTQALNDLNRTKISPEVRYSIIEILRPCLDVAWSNLSKRYLNQPLIMPEEPRQMAAISDRLITMATTAYTIVALETIQQRDSIRNTNPARLTCQAIQRALLFAGHKVLQTFQLHRPMEIHGWETLHQLYLLAENQQLADLPVPEPLSGGDTITTTYLQAIMLGCCKPNQLRQSDLASIYRGFQQWGNLLTLEREDTDQALFVTNLGSDQPPLYSSVYKDQMGPQCRYINTASLVQHLEQLKEKTDRATINFDKNSRLPANMLDHLIAALGSVSLRNFKRTAAENSLWICVGLSSIHFHVAGEILFGQLLYGREGVAAADPALGNPFVSSHNESDIWQDANPGDYSAPKELLDPDHQVDVDLATKARMFREDDAGLTLADRYPIFQVRVADASSGGYCMEWADELPGDVKTGDIIGLKEEQNKDWVIAVIRWLSSLDNARTLIGLELLSPRAIPYGARIHLKDGRKNAPVRVLLLPEIKLVGQPHTLITPRTGFKERQKVTLGNSTQTCTIQLLRHIASTASYAQFEFRFIRELGDVLAENQNGQPGGEFDSLWSNI